jgi:hypothetical protein
VAPQVPVGAVYAGLLPNNKLLVLLDWLLTCPPCCQQCSPALSTLREHAVPALVVTPHVWDVAIVAANMIRKKNKVFIVISYLISD